MTRDLAMRPRRAYSDMDNRDSEWESEHEDEVMMIGIDFGTT